MGDLHRTGAPSVKLEGFILLGAGFIGGILPHSRGVASTFSFVY